MRNKNMFIKYTFANKKNYDAQGISGLWIDVCEANNYIFKVVGENEDKYQLRIEKRPASYYQELVWIKKYRCEKYYSEYCEVILPKELFEI